MTNINNIKNYLQQGTRNKIVFCKDGIEGISFINVGTELAMLLGENPLEVSGFETMYRQVLNRSNHKDQIGTYLAIENDTLYFIDSTDGVSVKLQGLSYIQIWIKT